MIEIRALSEADRAAWGPLWRNYQVFYEIDIPEAVSLVHLIFHRSCWTSGDYCYLQDLFVHDSHRGRGIGRRLIDHAVETARAANCSRVHWLTHETNKDAMKLYDRVADRSGFLQYRKLVADVS